MSEATTGVRRVSIPLDGTPLDIAPLAGGGSGPVRVVLAGTVTSSLDGSEIDAFSRWTGATRHETEGPFVVLPPDARLVESDPLAHRYVVEIPRAKTMLLRFHVVPLATRYLVTRGVARESLTGAIEAEITIPAVAPLAAVAARARRVPLPVAFAGLALLGGGLLFLQRRRNREELRLQRRAKALVLRIRRDAHELGPVFDGVEASTVKLLGAIEGLRREIDDCAVASRRLRGLDPTRSWELSESLRTRSAAARAHMRTLVARLEELATQLAARGVEATRPADVGAVLERLDGEVGAAVRAERELQNLVR